MCGFVGFRVDRDFEQFQESLPEATLRLAHRGPDDSGLFLDADTGVGLGHRRLSIIDLSRAGRQPMTDETETVYLVLNGEVYNFKQIRQVLKGYGHQFKSQTDTEVVLKAYLQWGVDCLSRFVGMYVFALWDGRSKTLVLARDRQGIKPLYYHHTSGKLLFASELKALTALTPFPKNLDYEAIPLFLHYQYIPSPRTIYKDTYKLLPGHYAVFDGRDLSIRSYWTAPDVLDQMANPEWREMREEDALEEIDNRLSQAVSDRLISDVPIGGLLSGGIDSSTVVALMQKASNAKIKTFSIGFNEPGYDEAPWAEKVAAHLGTDHTTLYVMPGQARDVIPRLPEIYDEPFADSSAIPTFLVSQLARSRVTVALSGDGGDEQFCGYVRYWSTRAMADWFQRVPEAAIKLLHKMLGVIPASWVERCYLPWSRYLPQQFRVTNFPDKWQKLISIMSHAGIEEIYRSTICYWSREELYRLMGKFPAKSRYEETLAETEGWPILSRLMRVDQNTYLPDAMLTKVDRASMAVSLEVRVPLLDHRVVEFTSVLPDSLKYKNGKGKHLLRRLLARYVPEALFERPKMGFGVPIHQWLRRDMKQLLQDYLSVDRLRKEGLFDAGMVENMVSEHLTGEANHWYRLWSLLMWEMWRERWL
jgi:asparagine synthase (glutamine-hydrolysing)